MDMGLVVIWVGWGYGLRVEGVAGKADMDGSGESEYGQ